MFFILSPLIFLSVYVINIEKRMGDLKLEKERGGKNLNNKQTAFVDGLFLTEMSVAFQTILTFPGICTDF